MCRFDDYLVDVRKAEATKSEDIEVVLNLIQKMLPGGADYVNKVKRPHLSPSVPFTIPSCVHRAF